MTTGNWRIGFIAVILLGCLLQLGHSQTDNKILGIKNYACYYGKGRVSDLAKYDLVIIQDNYSAQEITSIRKGGTIVLGYISLGEDYPLKQGDRTGPGGYASWYLDYFIGDGVEKRGKDNKPDKSKVWHSYFVNTGDPKWQKLVLSKMDGLISKGFDGAFLDVVNYPYEYPEDLKEKALKPGLLMLIRRIRLQHPESYLVVNGSVFLGEIHELIDGVMCESFSSTGIKHNPEILAITSQEASAINKIRNYPENPDIVVFTLDYVKEGDTPLIAFDYERAGSFGFIPNVSYWDSYLTDLCMVNPANRFKAKREKDGIVLTWETPSKYLEESNLCHYIIRRSTNPIFNEANLKGAFLLSDKVPRDTNFFKDFGAPNGSLYYVLQAVNKEGMELVGYLKTHIEKVESRE